MARILLHVDMDAFYAAVEMRDDPRLVGKPLVIGADPRGGSGRGVVSTANYMARTYGIRSAMPISLAYAACPDAVFLPPDFPRYQVASQDVMEVLAAYADILQVVGMDEAYLDVTDALQGDWGRVAGFCRSLQAGVKRRTGLSCSVGAAPTKSAAKIASDRHKPHGVTVVAPGAVASFLDPLDVGLINGCGPKTAAALREAGIETVGQLADAPLDLVAGFGSHGRWLQEVAQGNDPRPVEPGRGEAKSRGNERTFPRDQANPEEVMAKAGELAARLADGTSDDRPFTTVTVKLRYADFSTLTRSQSVPSPIHPGPTADAHVKGIVSGLLLPLLDGRPVRLVGVRLSGFVSGCPQRPLSQYGMATRTSSPLCPSPTLATAGRRASIRPSGARPAAVRRPRQLTIYARGA